MIMEIKGINANINIMINIVIKESDYINYNINNVNNDEDNYNNNTNNDIITGSSSCSNRKN